MKAVGMDKRNSLDNDGTVGRGDGWWFEGKTWLVSKHCVLLLEGKRSRRLAGVAGTGSADDPAAVAVVVPLSWGLQGRH